MKCPKCKGENVTVEFVQTGGNTKKKGNGLGGHINNAARMGAMVCTVGLAGLVWKKSEGNEKMTYQNEKMCVCQDCGYSWKAKK